MLDMAAAQKFRACDGHGFPLRHKFVTKQESDKAPLRQVETGPRHTKCEAVGRDMRVRGSGVRGSPTYQSFNHSPLMVGAYSYLQNLGRESLASSG